MLADRPAGPVPGGYPVSVKGVVVRDGRVLLLRNDRAEWELPGGRLEPGETPPQCVVREIAEETGWRVRPGPLLDAWLYEVIPGRHVFVVTYGCHLTGPAPAPVLSSEHEAAGEFSPAQLAALPMPQGYRDSITVWLARPPDSGGPGA